MPFNNQADFGEFNAPKSKKNSAKPRGTADIISQAEEIVNAFALKSENLYEKNKRRIFPFAAAVFVIFGITALIMKFW